MSKNENHILSADFEIGSDKDNTMNCEIIHSNDDVGQLEINFYHHQQDLAFSAFFTTEQAKKLKVFLDFAIQD